MVKLVTVHGTGAGADSHAGEQWWQLGSPFLAALGQRLDLDPASVDVVPFQWGHGPNSEDGRRDAGRALYAQLRGYDADGKEYYLIGHSHGGSVIYNALLHSVARRKPLHNLKAWTTVGTPFLNYKANRFLFQRLGNIGLTIYATAIGVLLFALGFPLVQLVLGWLQTTGAVGADATALPLVFFTGDYLPVVALAVAYFLLSFLVLYAFEWFRSDRYADRVKIKAAELYSDRWTGLWHGDDEAISALSNVRDVNGPIIPANFLVPLFSLTPLVIMIATLGYLGRDFVMFRGPIVGFFHEALSGNYDLRSVSSLMQLGVEVFSVIGIALAAFIAVTFVLTAVLKFFAKWIGWPLSTLINGLVWGSIRQRAWGDDQLAESVDTVGSHPPHFANRFVALPDTIGDKISDHSERHAIMTLTKVRQMLGMTREPQKSPDMRSELSENLTWRELIHTSYFDIPEFVDFVALTLLHAGLSKPIAQHWRQAELDDVEGTLSVIRAG